MVLYYWSDEIVEREQNSCHALSCKEADQYQNPVQHPQIMFILLTGKHWLFNTCQMKL